MPASGCCQAAQRFDCLTFLQAHTKSRLKSAQPYTGAGGKRGYKPHYYQHNCAEFISGSHHFLC